MATMRRSGRGRPVATRDETSNAAEDAEQPIFDADADEARLNREFSEQFEFQNADSDLLSLGVELRDSGRKPRYEDLKDEYAALWAEMAVRRERLADADRIVQRIIDNKDRYRAVEASTAVPWYVIAVLHSLEASLNFRAHLHNGDPLTARTVHVPAGRPPGGQPPFTWEESAVDALTYDKITLNRDWSIERIAYILEGFNGWGYRLHHPDVKTPYLWSFSNHYTRGKYVADGKWSPTAVSGQCGAMVLLRRLDDKGAIRIQRSAPDVFSDRSVMPDVSGVENVTTRQGVSTSSDLETAAESDIGLELDPGCDFEVGQLREATAFAATRFEDPKPVPANDPVPFASSRSGDRHWPVITRHPDRLVVSYETVRGQIRGRPGRRFLAQRNSGARFHVGIDLFAHPNDVVVACEDGQIVAFYPFYSASTGEMTYALLVEHAEFVVNYGEVQGNAQQDFGWRVNDFVRAGQSIARINGTSMLHFETYQRGTRRNQRWLPGQPRPRALLNPTRYLLEMT